MEGGYEGCEGHPTALARQPGAKGKGGVWQGCQTGSAGEQRGIQQLRAARGTFIQVATPPTGLLSQQQLFKAHTANLLEG